MSASTVCAVTEGAGPEPAPKGPRSIWTSLCLGEVRVVRCPERSVVLMSDTWTRNPTGATFSGHALGHERPRNHVNSGESV